MAENLEYMTPGFVPPTSGWQADVLQFDMCVQRNNICM